MLEVWRVPVWHSLSLRAGLAPQAHHPHYSLAEPNPSNPSISDVSTGHGVLTEVQSHPASPLLSCWCAQAQAHSATHLAGEARCGGRL